MLKEDKVYVLQHSYEYGDENEFTETKFIGVYSSKKKAEEAIERLRGMEGFNKYPDTYFFIDAYTLDEDHWVEGFISFEEVNML